jgi:tetratricopeptide (TPR) repeat protein
MEANNPISRPRVGRLRREDERLSLSRETISLRSDSVPRDYADFEREFFEGVLKADPCEEGALTVLGHAYTAAGEIGKGLEIDQRLSRLRPDDPIVFYNLACSLSLMGRLDEAFDALNRAVSLGYRDLEHLMEDPDMENVRRDRRFEAVRRRMSPPQGPAAGRD